MMKHIPSCATDTQDPDSPTEPEKPKKKLLSRLDSGALRRGSLCVNPGVPAVFAFKAGETAWKGNLRTSRNPVPAPPVQLERSPG